MSAINLDYNPDKVTTTPGEIEKLAQMGLKYIELMWKQGIITWIGKTPTPEEIELFFKDLYEENPFFVSESIRED